MASSASSVSNDLKHAGPHLGIVATVFVVLFLAGLYPVTMFGGQPYFPVHGSRLIPSQHSFKHGPPVFWRLPSFTLAQRFRSVFSPRPL